MIFHGDCLSVLKDFKDASIDSLITDPPAGISFMGKDWDGNRGGRQEWVSWMSQVMRECLRVLKPGAHGLVWAIPRTSHWTATALEDAGFEIRDVVTHIFGSGFPKSYNISKAIDAQLLTGKSGPEALKEATKHRPVISKEKRPVLPNGRGHGRDEKGNVIEVGLLGASETHEINITAGATPEAKQWQGWGTALKPASEHWILVRKPTAEKTVAANVLKYGTGGLNIDGSRIRAIDQDKFARNWDRETLTDIRGNKYNQGIPSGVTNNISAPQGRFPANLVLSHNENCEDACTEGCAVAMLDAQSGISKSPKTYIRNNDGNSGLYEGSFGEKSGDLSLNFGDTGGASRFFYCAKASKADKNNGLDLSVSKAVGNRPNSADMTGKFPDHDQRERVGNFHPTVKSTKLMSYLIKLVTPPNGTVLDPFMGSGSTGIAALREGFNFLGIEMELEYVAISTKRIAHAVKGVK